jgi:hypothetical protein
LGITGLCRSTARSFRCAGLVAIFTVGALAAFSGAAAGAPAKRGQGLAQVVSPAMDGLARDGRVRVHVRLGPGVSSFSATLAGRSITRWFARRRGGRTRIATIRRSQVRGLRYGVNYLYVRTRRGRKRETDAVRFVLARRSETLMTSPLAARSAGAGRTRLRLRLGSGSAVVRATLNGRRIRTLATSGGSRSMTLDGDQRLHHGRNRLVLVAFHKKKGTYDVERRTIIMRRSRPIPAAGGKRRIGPGRKIRLDARHSRAARGGRLRYRWRVLSAPRNARPRLGRVTTRRPLLRVGRSGRYRIKLTVTERRGGRLSGVSDVVSVVARPDDPIGVPIDTLAGKPGHIAINVGDASYPPGNASAALQLLALDREQLTPTKQGSYPGTAAGTAQLLTDVRAISAGSLVIITTPRLGAVPAAPDDASVANISQALASIGGSPVKDPQSFSAIGVPGGNSPNVNPGLQLDGPGRTATNPGALRGYLALDSLGQDFSFVPSDYVAFNTAAPGTTANQAAITIGDCSTGSALPPNVPAPVKPPCKTYSSQTVSTQGGFFVLVLDAGTLAPRDQATFPIGPEGTPANGTNLQAMHALLGRYKGDPSALVFTQSIGSVTRDDVGDGAAAWNDVAQDQQDLGGHRYLFNQLGGSYALVGPGDKISGGCDDCLSPQAEVASQAATRTAGTLSGVLGRNERSQYHPTAAGPLGGGASGRQIGGALSPVVYQPPTPWPMRDGRACSTGGAPDCGHEAAIACITAGIAAKAELPIASPIERNYGLPDAAGGLLSALKSNLPLLSYANLPNVAPCAKGAAANPRFTSQEFDDVQEQLNVEFGYVGLVRDLVDDLQAPFQNDANGSSQWLLNAARQVTVAVNSVVPPSTPASYDPRTLSSEILGFVSYLPIPVVSNVAGLMAEGIAIGVTLTTRSGDNTAPALPPDVETTADGLALELAQGYGAAADNFDQIGRVLVSDWAKLQTAAVNADPGNGSAIWTFPDSETTRTRNALGLAAQKLGFDTLFPLGYSLYNLDKTNQPNPSLQYPAEYQCKNWKSGFDDEYGYYWDSTKYTPFASVPNFGDLFPVLAAGSPQRLWAFANKDTSFVSNASKNPTGGRAPPQSLINTMFVNKPVVPSGSSTVTLSDPPLSQLRFSLDGYADATRFYNVSTYSTKATDILRGTVLDDQCKAESAPLPAR